MGLFRLALAAAIGLAAAKPIKNLKRQDVQEAYDL